MMRRKKFEATVQIGMLLLGVIGMCIVSITIASVETTTTQPVPGIRLYEFLPDAPSGWVETKVYSYPKADGYYFFGGEEGGTRVRIGVSGVIAYSEFYDYESSEGYQSTEGYKKKVTFKGFPAWERYNEPSSKAPGGYGLLVNINDRFVVDIFSADKNTLYDFANQIDYNGIATLSEGAESPSETTKPTEQPTQPPAKETPPTLVEEKKTPGFEAIFEIAGLSAIAYILRRCRK